MARNQAESDESIPAATAVKVVRYRQGQTACGEDHVATEEPLEIRVRGRAISITMRTPGHDAELAAGFLLTEGVIRQRQDVERIEPCTHDDAGSVLNVVLAPDVAVDFQSLTRHVFASSSCGVCGKATIGALRKLFPVVESGLTVDAEMLLELPQQMRNAQATFAQTGGLHAAALFDARGRLLVLREDVGRHNAVDKVIGNSFLNRMLDKAAILLVSGRTSFEIMQKALAGRIAVIAAISAPSSLAVELAEANGQTLIGFLRDGRMNIYAGAQRIRAATGA